VDFFSQSPQIVNLWSEKVKRSMTTGLSEIRILPNGKAREASKIAHFFKAVNSPQRCHVPLGQLGKNQRSKGVHNGCFEWRFQANGRVKNTE